MIDQRLLPEEVVYREYRDAAGVAEAIRTMVVRGAPAIGAAAAYGLAAQAAHSHYATVEEMLEELEDAARVLGAARPTAVNLSWAIARVLDACKAARYATPDALRAAVLAEAHAIAAAEVAANRQIGLNALPLIPQKAVFIHHCNTGPLATVDIGTALGVIATAHQHGREVFVYVDETRPRLQGARLTAWELGQMGIPYAVIVDGASGHIMRTRHVDLVVVGGDRVAANGDVANKVGTYNLALAAHAHGVPFYSVVPTSTIDLSIATGDEIPIEEREADEVTCIGNQRITPAGTPVVNPAFDVTPARYITAIITEAGVAYPPFEESLAGMMQR